MSTIRFTVAIELDGDPDHDTLKKYHDGLHNAVRELSESHDFIPEDKDGNLLNVTDVIIGIA